MKITTQRGISADGTNPRLFITIDVPIYGLQSKLVDMGKVADVDSTIRGITKEIEEFFSDKLSQDYLLGNK